MKTETWGFIFCILLGILIFSVGCFLGNFVTEHNFEIEAVEEGHARFYIDENHLKQWEWLLPLNEVEETKKDEE